MLKVSSFALPGNIGCRFECRESSAPGASAGAADAAAGAAGGEASPFWAEWPVAEFMCQPIVAMLAFPREEQERAVHVEAEAWAGSRQMMANFPLSSVHPPIDFDSSRSMRRRREEWQPLAAEVSDRCHARTRISRYP
ncbi:hypothetical protein FGB62_25g048 [Gracilaria domingensis]|nr:hypothetical protein FGB62_25g048 [Gracilaria domingensis]